MGWAWLALRGLYPVIWALNGGMTMKILAVTLPMYGIVMWLMGSTVVHANFTVDLKALLYGYDAEKVQRLAEVEAMLLSLSQAASAAPEVAALSPEEAAKAAWLAARARPAWGPGSNMH